ncbi:MFS transporter [Acuticoccus sp.]|uniref:MFS transporter n=1 Tax=Acuticoccus sp. TaxID=1904378 RepID=UPI003B52A7E9
MALALRVFLPFAFAYLLAYLMRVVNAVAGAPLTAEFGLSPADLGLLTSVYFVGFAVMQIPFGVLMDRYGPRRVEALALLFAAAGCVLFALAAASPHLLLGRFLMGLGASMSLMAPMTAYRSWFTPERRALVIGLHMAFGGLGSAIAGGPAEALIDAVGWRGMFLVLSGGIVVAALTIALVVPRQREPQAAVRILALTREVASVLRSPALWRVAPLSATVQVGMLAVVGLWAGPWLREVAGMTDDVAAGWLSAAGIGLVAGFLFYGALFARVERTGHATTAFVVGSLVTVAFPLVLIVVPPSYSGIVWILYAAVGSVGVHSYNIATSAFPAAMAGRVNTALNFVVFVAAFLGQWGFGVVLAAYPGERGQATYEGFQAAFLLLIAIQLVSALPLLFRAGGRRADARAH